MRYRLAAIALLLLAVMPLAAEVLDQHGKAHVWRGVSGQYTVVDFAASWCGPCWRTLPKLQALAEANPSIVFLVVSVDDDVRGRDRLVERVPLTLPTLWDEGYVIAEHYKPEGMPATYVIDPDGEVIYHHSGASAKDWTALVATVEKLSSEE